MAKILFTAVVADMRNKLNGTVFSKNRYGSYTRTKVTPVNPQTDLQQEVRNRLSTNSQNWRGLTESQRLGWINAAPNFPRTDIYGNPKILSGNALYVALNNNLMNVNETAISDAPNPVAIPALSITSLTATAGTQSLSLGFDPSAVPTDFALLVQATPNVGPGISFVKNKFRKITFASAAVSSPLNILTAFQGHFGNVVEGMKIYVRCQLISTVTGQAGIPVTTSVIVAA